MTSPHRWRQQSTRHRHFPTGSLLNTKPKMLSFRDILHRSCGQANTLTDTDTSTDSKGRLKLAAREPKLRHELQFTFFILYIYIVIQTDEYSTRGHAISVYSSSSLTSSRLAKSPKITNSTVGAGCCCSCCPGNQSGFRLLSYVGQIRALFYYGKTTRNLHEAPSRGTSGVYRRIYTLRSKRWSTPATPVVDDICTKSARKCERRTTKWAEFESEI